VPSVPYGDPGEAVSSVAYPSFMTVEEFETYPFPDGKVELVRGEPRVMSPAGGGHGVVQGNLSRLLLPFVHQQRLGRVFNDGVGFELIALPRTVRNPDLSFVRSDRLPSQGIRRRGFLKMAPDLAVEILSPDESAAELQEKVDDYQASGTPLIWVIDPERYTVRVLQLYGQERVLGADETLDGGDVIPGFTCPVWELFEGLAPA
jgi:Uma2 family endonuclease